MKPKIKNGISCGGFVYAKINNVEFVCQILERDEKSEKYLVNYHPEKPNLSNFYQIQGLRKIVINKQQITKIIIITN